MTAADILKAALGHMEDRAATYDKPEGERSMPATVEAFNALTGHQLTAEQGWLFMTVLKLCRTQQGGFRADNYEDGSAYFALMGEQASGDRVELSFNGPTGTCDVGPVSFAEQADPDGWIEFHPDKPVPGPGELVDLQFGDGSTRWGAAMGMFSWQNVVAYRISPWVRHFGKGSDISGLSGAKLEVKHRDKTTSEVQCHPTGSYWNWATYGPRGTDILAYRRVE